MSRTVFVDVDTQIDFVFPAGALYVPGAARILPVVARLNSFAAAHGLLVLSTVDAHPENDGEFTEYAAHCVRDALGQRKPEATLLSPRTTIPELPCLLPDLAAARQLLIEKTSVDCFRNRNLARLLTELGVTRCVVYGVAAEVAVHHACLGLLRAGLEVLQVADATQHVHASIARRARNDFEREGGRFVESTGIAHGLLEPRYGTPVP